MAVTTASARMAHALLARLEAEGKLDDSLRYEILNGELVIRGVARIRHDRAVSALVYHFVAWTRGHGGEAFGGSGIEIGPQQLRPDLIFIGPQRATEVDEDGFHVPPDLVVEVTSPGSRSLDLHEKREIYEALGVTEYWVVDHTRDVVLVHRLDAGAYTAPRSPKAHSAHGGRPVSPCPWPSCSPTPSHPPGSTLLAVPHSHASCRSPTSPCSSHVASNGELPGPPLRGCLALQAGRESRFFRIGYWIYQGISGAMCWKTHRHSRGRRGRNFSWQRRSGPLPKP